MKKFSTLFLCLSFSSIGLLAQSLSSIHQNWGTYFGGSGAEEVTDAKYDKFGNLYLVGTTTGSSGIASAGAHQITFGGGSVDGFIIKFSPSGVRLWSTYYGGAEADHIYGCAVDTFGNLYVSGTTASANNIASGGFRNSINPSGNSVYGTDAFLVKFNGAGVRQWGTYVGSSYQNVSDPSITDENYDYGYTCATDVAGNVILAGYHNPVPTVCHDINGNVVPCATPNYVSTLGAYQQIPVSAGSTTAESFVVKFSGSGSRLWGTYFGAMEWSPPIVSQRSNYLHCALDANGNVFLAASVDSSSAPNLGFGGFQNTPSGQTDCWLAKFNPGGSSLLWCTYYGGKYGEAVTGLAADGPGNVFMTGTTLSDNAGNKIATPGTFENYRNQLNTEYPFLVAFDASGSRKWGTFTCKEGGQNFSGNCATDASGNVYVANTISTAFGTHLYSPDLYCGTHYNTNGQNILWFSGTGQHLWGDMIQGNWGSAASICAVDHSGKNRILASATDVLSTDVPMNAFQSVINGSTDAYAVNFRDTVMTDTICGHVFYDDNANGVMDGTETYLTNQSLSITIHQNLMVTSTDASGFYSFVVPVWGNEGSCYSSLYCYAPSNTTASRPLGGLYPASIVGQHGGCQYDFAFAPAFSVTGTVYYDDNHNGSNNSEPGIGDQSVSFNSQRQAFTSNDGRYTAWLPIGSYTENFDKLDVYSNSISSPAQYNISSYTAGSVVSGKDFGAYFPGSAVNSSVNIYQTHVAPIPGGTVQYTVMVNNIGAVSSADTLVFHFDPSLTFTGSGSGLLVNNSLHTITVITPVVVPGRTSYHYFSFAVSTSAVPGAIIQNSATVNPTAQPDSDVTNNQVVYSETVLASLDPNIKVSETNTDTPTLHYAPLYSAGEDYIQYTINFQNTGTFAAQTIVVLDTLSSNLDWSSLRLLSYSHHCNVSRSGSVLTFRFDNINLINAAVNDSLSHGYVSFRVKPKVYAVPGDSIVNRAAIFFDYNHPVFTENNIVHLKGDSCRQLVKKHIYDSKCSLVNYIFDGDTIHQFGIHYGDTLTSVSGCDSVTILHISRINTINYKYIYAHQCNLQNYYFSGHLITAAGTYYSDTLPNMYGCDSVAVLTLSTAPYTTDVYLNQCDSITIYDGDTLSGAGDFTSHYTALDGCDSTVTIHVSVGNYYRFGSYYLTTCQPPLIFGGNVYNNFGTYYDTIPATQPGQCDSVTELFYYQQTWPAYGYLNDYVCGGYYNYYGNIYTDPGSYSVTLYGMAQGGCDSIVQITLYPGSTTGQRTIQFCTPTYLHNGVTYFDGQFYIDTLVNSAGCDSLLYVNLLQTTGILHIEYDSTCSLQPLVHNSRTYDIWNKLKDQLSPSYQTVTSLFFTDTFSTSSGCDSFSTLIVTVHVPSTGYTGYSNVPDPCGHTGTSNSLHYPGFSSQVFPYPAGCDSLYFENVWPSQVHSYYVCPNDSVLVNGHWRTISSQIFADTLIASCGIDSIDYSQVVDGSTVTQYLTRDTAICLGDTVWVNGSAYTEPTGVEEYTTTVGCQTVIHYLYINYQPGVILHDTFTVYQDSTVWLSVTYPVPITLIDTIAPNGCSSVPILHTTTFVNPTSFWINLDTIIHTDCQQRGKLHVTGHNGQPPYRYRWSTGDTTATISNLKAGYFYVTVRDASGTVSYNGAQIDSGYYFNYFTSGGTCFGDSIQLSLQLHARNPFVSVYENGSLLQNSNNLFITLPNTPVGRHTYVVNSNGCVDTIGIRVPGNGAYFENMGGGNCSGGGAVLHYNTYELAHPAITVNIDQGTWVRTYHQMEGVDTFNGLSAGYHYYTVSVPGGCSLSDSFLIGAPNLQAALHDSLLGTGCAAQHLLYANTTGGVMPLQYVWSSGATTPFIVVSGPASLGLTLTDSAGCSVHLTTNVNGGSGLFRDTTVAAVCNGQSYSFGQHWYTVSGIFSDTFQNANGCDSIRTLLLTVGQFATQKTLQTICSGDSFLWRGAYYHAAGIYSDTLSSSSTCDTVLQLQLSLQFGTLYSMPVTICAGGFWMFKGQPISQPGTYRDTLKNFSGCDSIIEVRLSVDTIEPVLISGNGTILATSQTYSSYQWLKNYNAITGANGSQLTVSSAGSYALKVTDSKGCIDTSNVIVVSGLNEVSTMQIGLYPNPNDGAFTLSGALGWFEDWKLTDALGRVVAEGKVTDNHQRIQTEMLSAGAYFFQLQNGNSHWKQTVFILK